MQCISTKEFMRLASYIESNYGIHLKEEKKALVAGRLHGILAKYNLSNFEEYYAYLLNDQTGEATAELINRITTNHTFFMREAEHFAYVRECVLPFLEDNVPDHDLRIWSAGCSSGEEAYTLAMILKDYFGDEKESWDYKVLATDISEKVLDEAKGGHYSREEAEMIPWFWLQKYFIQGEAGNVEIADAIRKEVIFRRFNLMENQFPFRKKFHVIFCRNVMIYFDKETKNQLVQRFYDMTEEGGYLFVGHAESLNREETGYQYVMPSIYRKKKK